MRSAIWALAFAATTSVGAAAYADDTHVRTSATVEVLDEKAQIDDVISRMRAQQAREAKPHPSTLHEERPPAPPSSSESHRTVGPDGKSQPPGTRRPNRERNGNPDHTERPRAKKK
jgi:hypothetical protein